MNMLREKCGVVGFSLSRSRKIGRKIIRGLAALQHRGQDGAGLVIHRETTGFERKVGMGLVKDVFTSDDEKIQGRVGIGHTRYPTEGEVRLIDVMPFCHENIALAHNGHIANFRDLKAELEGHGYEFRSSVDSEALLYLLDHSMKNGADIEGAVLNLMEKVVGAYSIVAIIDGKLIAFRDPHGIRPLVFGTREKEEGVEYCVASESAALETNNFEYGGQIKGGELVIITEKRMERKPILEKKRRLCMFEHVYFSHTTSIIDDLTVVGRRARLGTILAREKPVDADVVVAIPNTARTAAHSFAQELRLPVQEGLIKRRGMGRTFIEPDPEKRVKMVARKFHVVKEFVEGKRVVLIDDSVVRGTTIKQIVKMMRESGAREVHLRITCPPIVSPCVYGVAFPSYEELVAVGKSEKEVGEFIGVDSIGYLSIPGLKEALGNGLCTGCLDGDYFNDFVTAQVERAKIEGGKVGYGCSNR